MVIKLSIGHLMFLNILTFLVLIAAALVALLLMALPFILLTWGIAVTCDIVAGLLAEDK